MKKVIFMGVLGLFLLGSCNSKSGDSHEGHNHETEEHNHDGHDHEGHDHEHEEHNHEHEEQENHAGGSDEIILPPAKAQAAGVAVSTVEPGSFHQVNYLVMLMMFLKDIILMKRILLKNI